MVASTRKRKRSHIQLRTSVPAKHDIVTRVEVVRNSNQRIRTTSTKVSIPVTHVPSLHHTPPHTSEPLPDDASDPTAKKPRKGPSRSVAVRAPTCSPSLVYLT
jgi:hypothetical protein